MNLTWFSALASLPLLLSPLVSTLHAAAPSRPTPEAAFSLELDPTDSAPPLERLQIQAFLDQVSATLPERLKTTLKRKVTLRFEALDGAPGVYVPPCIGSDLNPEVAAQTLGEIRAASSWPLEKRRALRELVIHQGFRAEILGGEAKARTYPCGHTNLYRLAMATVIHELGHLYDYASPHTPQELTTLRVCEIAQEDSEECRQLRERKTISTQDRFRNLMGWVETGNFLIRSRKQENRSHLRSPDPYEFTHPEESFSVNLEYFLLDPEFACRRPSVHRFFSSHFEVDPHPGRSCRTQTQLPLFTGIIGTPNPVAQLDPSRVYEIHALFAGKGPSFMSKWGHTLFRIILCDPAREQPGPDCMIDVGHHVVVSFRANVSDLSISYWKGLTGQYSSLLFTQPFLAVIEEYNKADLRELISLPLKLTTEQKTTFIERVLEASWEYSGRYRFINNNCAIEGLNFLKSVLGITEDHRLNRWHAAKPNGLHEMLQELEISDASVLKTPRSDAATTPSTQTPADGGGYYYASKKPELDSAFKGIRDALEATCGAGCLGQFPDTLEEYLDETQAALRRSLYDQLWDPAWSERRASAKLTRKVTASRFFLLETFSIRRFEMSRMRRITAALEDGFTEGLPKESKSQVNEIKAKAQRLVQLQQRKHPAFMQGTGYGIPIQTQSDWSELQKTQDRASPQKSLPELEEESRLIQEITDWAKKAFKKEAAELEASSQNHTFFMKEMRSK
ncbi:MAG: DUF4105 domain-containing protein [Oligoflexia bacterium]